MSWLAGAEESQSLELKVRALYIDGHAKELTIGAPHEITDHLFVVRRAMRLNDSLPEESNAPRWIWQPAGWIMVDRVTGRVSQVNLPQFDPATSSAVWYRDYAAYCGVSDDGQKIHAVVTQFGRRKPILNKLLGDAKSQPPDAACPTPIWQRHPPRVTFSLGKDQKFTYTIRGHAADVVMDGPEQE